MSTSEQYHIESACLRDAILEVFTCPSSVVEEFSQVWERIGLNESQCQTRRDTIVLHVTNLLKDMAQEELELEKKMISSIENNEKELKSLHQQLGLPVEGLPENLSLYEKEKSARHRVDALNKIKFERQKRVKRIREMETSLCKELGEKSQLSMKSSLPSEDALKCYLHRVEGLEQTLNKRQKRHRELKLKVQEICTHLEMELEKEYAVFSNQAAKGFVYSSDNMNTLEESFLEFEVYVQALEKTASELWQEIDSLWERLEVPEEERRKVQEVAKSFRPRDISVLKKELERLNELKSQHMETFICKTREELKNIWDECLYGSQQRREFAPAFQEGSFDDDLLSAHESELDRMRGFYRDNQEIFKLVMKREEMFRQYCELERKNNDPARFSNRGGQLLKDQAMKKQLTKELPRVEKELNGVLLQWEEDHERFFMVQDGRYLDTIKMQWREKQLDKCNEKTKRQKEKEVMTLMEMTYGSKPSTPKRKVAKRAAASPLAATGPVKLRKVEQSPLVRPTTVSGSRLPRASRIKNTKTPVRPLQKLKEERRERRRILADKNSSVTPAIDESFLSMHNFSLASAGSYTDFQHGIKQNEGTQRYLRSSSILSKENTS